MLEINIDVGRFAPLGRDEALKENVDAGWIYGSDAKAIADSTVGGRSPALAENLLLFGKAHHVIDGQEIAGIVELLDEPQFLRDQGAHILRYAVWIAALGQPPGQLLEIGLRSFAGRDRFIRIFVAKLFEIEFDLVHDLNGTGKGLRVGREEARHLRGGLQVPLGIGLKPVACLSDGALLADAHEYVGERFSNGMVIKNVVRRQQRGTRPGREFSQRSKARALVAPVPEARRQIHAAPGRARQHRELVGKCFRQHRWRDDNEDLSL